MGAMQREATEALFRSLKWYVGSVCWWEKYTLTKCLQAADFERIFRPENLLRRSSVLGTQGAYLSPFRILRKSM
jgi:hypothetical protein